MRTNDLTTLQAVLGGKHYLSGLTEEMKAHFTRKYRELTTPDLAQRLGVMRAALAQVEQRASLVFIEVEKAQGAKFSVVAQLRKSQSAAESALALINNPVQKS